MKFLRSGEPIADPFFAAVRRRHPDVDLVMLPPEPALADDDRVDDDAVSASLIRVATQAKHLWAAIAPGAAQEPEARLDYGAGPASVRAIARISVLRADGYEVLVRLRHELESHGWEIRRPAAPIERLTAVFTSTGSARREDLDVAASYAEETGVLTFSLSAGSLVVGVDRARALTNLRRQRGER